MNCKEYVERLARFLESDFDPELAKELAAHADECAGCEGSRVDDSVARRVRDCYGDAEAPKDLRERIERRIGPDAIA